MSEMINVNFGAYTAVDSDTDSILSMLKSGTFLGCNFSVNDVAGFVIEHNQVTNVLKQMFDDAAEDEDSDEEDVDANVVYAICSIINLANNARTPIIAKLKQHLLDVCTEHGSAQNIQQLTNLLNNAETAPVGMLISDRVFNLPADASIPLLGALQSDMTSCVSKGMPYDFKNIIIISKIQRYDEDGVTEDVFCNNEDEKFQEVAEYHFDYPCKVNQSRYSHIPIRRVMVLTKNNFMDIINSLCTMLQTSE